MWNAPVTRINASGMDVDDANATRIAEALRCAKPPTCVCVCVCVCATAHLIGNRMLVVTLGVCKACEWFGLSPLFVCVCLIFQSV
jgi:hypothetical protein